MATYVFDLDGTLCSDSMGTYRFAQPLIERIKHVNSLYDEGNVIII